MKPLRRNAKWHRLVVSMGAAICSFVFLLCPLGAHAATIEGADAGTPFLIEGGTTQSADPTRYDYVPEPSSENPSIQPRTAGEPSYGFLLIRFWWSVLHRAERSVVPSDNGKRNSCGSRILLFCGVAESMQLAYRLSESIRFDHLFNPVKRHELDMCHLRGEG